MRSPRTANETGPTALGNTGQLPPGMTAGVVALIGVLAWFGRARPVPPQPPLPVPNGWDDIVAAGTLVDESVEQPEKGGTVEELRR